MATVSWDPVMCAGLDFMDDEHRALVSEVDGLTHMIADGSLAAAATRFRALIERTRAHFRDEEAFMRAAGYPGQIEHKAEHDDFLDHLELFARRFGTGGIALHEDMMRFVSLWFLGHILGSDKRMHAETSLPHAA